MIEKKDLVVPHVQHYLLKYVKKGYKILDIGCGVAQYRTVTPAIYVGLDVTNEPYKEGHRREVDVVATAEKLPLANNTFDIVFMVASFYLIPDKEKALGEFYRILKPGGRILVFDYNRKTHKKLEYKGGHGKLPCWTQYALKRMIRDAGYKDSELLLSRTGPLMNLFKGVFLVAQELRGTWAIVTGVKG